MNPPDGIVVEANRTLHLWGIVTLSTFERAVPKIVRWTIDDREVASGLDAYVVSPPEGEHVCKLYIEEEGETVEKIVFFKSITTEST